MANTNANNNIGVVSVTSASNAYLGCSSIPLNSVSNQITRYKPGTVYSVGTSNEDDNQNRCKDIMEDIKK